MKYLAVMVLAFAIVSAGACEDSKKNSSGLDAAAGDDVAPDAGTTDGAPTPADDADTDVAVGDAPVGPAADATPSSASLVASRPYMSTIPTTYNPQVATPLVIVLHGYGVVGSLQAQYFGLISLADSRGFLLAYPDGSVDLGGSHFWNATDACCNFYGSPVDDVAYVNAVIDDMSARYNVDAHRIFLVGHSNGGFMSHRASCDLSPRIAAMVSLAGAQWKDPARCQPTSPVAVLQVHGDADATIAYEGGRVDARVPPFPSAMETVATWAAKNGCDATLAAGPTIDLVDELPGAETQVARYGGCRAAVELWTIHGGVHAPKLNASWAGQIYDFLLAHPKP